MKKLLLSCAILSAVITPLCRAQDVTGPWQGTLAAGKSLRVVLQVAKDGDALKGKFFSIDQGGPGISTSGLVIQGATFHFAISAIDVVYDGKLSADHKSVVGTWAQGGSSLPLNLEHVTAETAWEIPKPQAAQQPMPASADPFFEIATIKPTRPDEQGKMFTMRGERFMTVNTSLEDLITFGYSMQQKQIVGAPPWAGTDKFDIEAKPDIPGTPNDQQLRSMVRKLLVERFALKFHTEKKELSIYALSVGKAGPKLTRSEGDPKGLPGLFFRGLGKLTVRNATMADFTRLMQSAVLDRPVADQTGLTDRFDFTLEWTPDESQFGGLGVKVPPPTDAADAPPTLFSAMQEQLGLRLEPTKAPIDVLVIDKAEKPGAN